MVTIERNGRTIRKSKNLRCIMDYARTFRAGRQTMLAQHGKTLIALFPDGASCKTDFTCEGVLRHWIDGRVKYSRGKFEQLPIKAQ